MELRYKNNKLIIQNCTKMEKVGYKEYLNALEKVNRFHIQLKSEEQQAKAAMENLYNKNTNESILDLLKKYSNGRTVKVVGLFLESEIRNRKIPFLCVDDVPCNFFVEHYTFSELKQIRGIGLGSFLSLQRILQETGYTLLI